jgi:hypothetical protein
MSNDSVTISLTVEEFVVLDELLRRYSTTGKLAIADPAEQNALFALTCIFEREPTRSDSWPSLADARKSLRYETD